MKKTLNDFVHTLAHLLQIRITNQAKAMANQVINVAFSTFDYKEVPLETKQLFIKKIAEVLSEENSKLQIANNGKAHFVFGYMYDNVLPLGTIHEEMSDDLARIVDALPELGMMECYVFPDDTFLEITITPVDGRDGYKIETSYSTNLE